MKKLLLTSVFVASALFGQDAELQKVKNDLENNSGLKNFNTKILEIQKLKNTDGWYTAIGVQETQQGNRTFNFTTNKNVIIFGGAYDINSGENLSLKVDYNKLKESANYTIGNGEKEYFLITDPECPYCKQLEEKLPLLKDKAKIHVFLTADVIPTHWLAKGVINYINSLPADKKEAEARKLFLEKDNAEILKKVDKYNLSLYKNLKEFSNNPQAKQLTDMYFRDLSKAFKIDLSTDEKKNKFLDSKIAALSKIDTKKVDEIYANTKNTLDMYFNPNGTPTVIEVNTGRKLENQFEMFAQTKTIDLAKIKDITKNKDLTVVAGKKGAKKAYSFISTQCPACVQEFRSDKLNKLLSEYEVHFLLGTSGGNPLKAEYEMKHILSLQEDKRFEALSSIMKGEQLSREVLEKTYDESFDRKIEGLAYDMFQTMVFETPTILDENGKNIR